MYNKEVYKTWALVLQLGISVLVPILLLVAVGSMIKTHFGVDFMLFFVIFGVLVGVRNVYVILRNYLKTIDKKKNKESELMQRHRKSIEKG